MKIILNEREQREYDLASAILKLADTYDSPSKRTGLVFEISDDLAKRAPNNHGGLFVPHSMDMRAGLDTATSTKGAELKFTEAYTFIDTLRNKTVAIRAGATVLDGLTADASIPKATGAATAAWTGQNPGSDVADSNPTFTSVGLAPHELIATTSYSRQLLAQSKGSASVDGIVRNDLAKIHGVAIDAAAFTGSGASGQPLGLFNRADLAAITVAFGTNGALPSWPLMCQFEKLVGVANGETDPPTGAFVVTPEVRYRLRTTDRTGGSSGWFILPDDGGIASYPVLATNQLPKTLVKGTSGGVCHGIAFGDFSEMLIGLWGAFEIAADPFRLKKQGMIELTTYQLADVSVRHIGAFAVSIDSLA